MSNSIHLISLLLLASGLSIQAQEKRAMTFDEMVGWERISEQRISDNGKWVFCKMEPWRGDATILLYNDKGEEKGSFKPAAKAQFSSSSEYLLVTKTPPLKEVEAEKLKKTDKDKMPMNSLIISRLSGGMETIDSLKSYKLSETADWLAYQRGSKKDSMLYIRSLDGMQQDSFPAVSDSDLPKKGMCYTSYPTLSSIPTFLRKEITGSPIKKGYSRRLHSTKTVASSLTCFVPIKIRPQPGAACIWQKIIPPAN